MGGFGSAKGSNSFKSYMIENKILYFLELFFPILIISPYYSVTLFENIRLWTKIVLHWLQNPTNFFAYLSDLVHRQTANKIIWFFWVYFKWNMGFFVGFFFDPLNALKSIMFVEYFYAQHSPGAVQDGVQIPLVPAGYLAIEWTFWTRTFGLYRAIQCTYLSDINKMVFFTI